VNSLPVGNVIGSLAIWVMVELGVPSNKQSLIGGIVVIVILCLDTNDESKKQWDEPESIRVCIDREFGIVRDIKRESGLERADALSQMNFATRSRSTQPSAREDIT
jgi:hypothetical protein